MWVKLPCAERLRDQRRAPLRVASFRRSPYDHTVSDESEVEREVRQATRAERKPWWFAALGLALVVGCAFAAERVAEAGGARSDASPLFGLAAGALLTVTILGHSPGRYRDARTGEYETFWSRRSGYARGGCAVAAALMIATGVVIDRLVLGR